MRIIVTFLFFALISFTSIGQVTKFSEMFDEANGSTSGVSAEGIPWNATFTGVGNMPNVSGGVYRNNNSDGVSTWLSNNIDVSQCQKLVFSMDYTSSLPWSGSGNMEHCGEAGGCSCDPYNGSSGPCANNWDFIYLEIILDGVVHHSEIVGLNAATPQSYNFAYSSACFTPGDYNFAQIKVMTQTWAGDEVISFDNVNLGCYENLSLNIANIGPFCETDPSTMLMGSPPGGTWSGAGVSGNQFNPGNAGPGIHEVTYSFDQAGCPSLASIFVLVNPELTTSFNLDDEYCINEAPVILPVISPQGVDGTWNPATISTAAPGTITYTFTPTASECATPYSFQVLVNDAPTITLSADPDPLCAGDDLTLHAGGGTGYSWTGPGGFTSNSSDPVITNVTVAASGTYFVTVTDANGCVNNSSIVINVTVCGCIDPPLADAGSDDGICEGETFQLNGSVNTTATWTSSGDGTFSDLNNTNTIYTPGTNDISSGTVTLSLTANDPDGAGPCVAHTDDLILTINDLPIVNITAVGVQCLTDLPVNLNATPAGGTWSGPGVSGNQFDPAVASVGNHIIIYSVTDFNGCDGMNTIQIAVQDCGCVAPPVANAGNDDDICAGEVVNLNGSVNTSALWTGNGSGTFANANNAVTTYTPSAADITNGSVILTLTSLDPDGPGPCIAATDQVTITIISLNAVIDPLTDVCINNGVITLTGSPAGGSWSGSGVTGNQFDPSIAGVGPHSINYTINQGSCSDVASATITVFALPVVNITPVSNLCVSDQPVNLVGNPAEGIWSGNGVVGSQFDPTLAGAGQHAVSYTFEDNNGCEGIATIQIVVSDCGCANPAQANAGLDQIICNTEVVNLSGTANTGSIWSGNGTGVFTDASNPITTYTPSAQDINAGSVILTLTALDPDGVGPCTSFSDQIIITITTLQPTAANVGDLCLSDSPVQLSDSWNGGGIWSGPGVNGQTFDPAAAGVGSHLLTYSVSDNNGCSGSTTITINVTNCDCADPALSDAGPDQDFCGTGTINLSGQVNTSPNWTGNGSGSFDDVNNANAIYTPSAADIIAGTVVLTLTASDPDGAGPCKSVTDNMTITFTTIDIVIDPVTDLCLDASPVNLTASPSGGTWSGPGVTVNQFDPSAAGAGIHNVVYSASENGCSATESISVNVNPLPIVSLSPVADLCQNDAVIIFSNGSPAGGIYYIDGDLSNPVTDFDPLTIGSFTLSYIYTDINGCTNESQIDINVLDCACGIIVTADAGPDQEICEGEIIQLNGIVTGVINGTWTTAGDGSFSDINDLNSSYNPGPTDISNGLVILTLTSEDPDGPGPCSTVSNTMKISIIGSVTITMDPVNDLCHDAADITLIAFPIGGSFSGPGISGNIFLPSLAGIGTHTIYYEAGIAPCIAIDSINIDVVDCSCTTTVIVDAGPDQEICEGDPVNISATLTGVNNGIWITNGSGSFNNAGSANAIYTPSANDIITGNLVLTFTSDDPDGNGPCVAEGDQLNLLIFSQIDLNLEIVQPNCITNTGSVEIQPVSGQNLVYSTDNGQTYNPQTLITDLDPGNYTLFAKYQSAECVSSIDFVIDEVTLPEAEWLPKYAACGGSENELILQSGTDLELPLVLTVNGQNPATINSLPYNFPAIIPGSYKVTIVDANGCVLKSDFDFESGSELSITADDLYVVARGESVILETEISGDYNEITWTPETFLNCSDCPEPLCTPLENTAYIVRVTDERGCTDEAEISVRVSKVLVNVFAPNVISPNSDGINDHFTVFTDENVQNIRSMKIFNRWGSPVFERYNFEPNNESLGWDGTYRGQAVNPDVFVYVIEVEVPLEGIRLLKGNVTVIK